MRRKKTYTSNVFIANGFKSTNPSKPELGPTGASVGAKLEWSRSRSRCRLHKAFVLGDIVFPFRQVHAHPIRRHGLSLAKQPQSHSESPIVEVDHDPDSDDWVPPEGIYDELEKFFPKHDIDRPVIDTPSGRGSPEAVDALPPPRMRAKKSIRIVAQEHKKRIDGSSSSYTSATLPVRKRNTRLWGSRLEVVTAIQPRSPDTTPRMCLTLLWRVNLQY